MASQLPPLPQGKPTRQLISNSWHPRFPQGKRAKIVFFVCSALLALVVVSGIIIVAGAYHNTHQPKPVVNTQRHLGGHFCEWPQTTIPTLLPPSSGATPDQQGFTAYGDQVTVGEGQVLLTNNLLRQDDGWMLEIDQIAYQTGGDNTYVLADHATNSSIIGYDVTSADYTSPDLQVFQWVEWNYGWTVSKQSVLQIAPADRCSDFNPAPQLSYTKSCYAPRDPQSDAEQFGSFGLNNDYGGTKLPTRLSGNVTLVYATAGASVWVGGPKELSIVILGSGNLWDVTPFTLDKGILGYYLFDGPNTDAISILAGEAIMTLEYDAAQAGIRTSDEAFSINFQFAPEVDWCNTFK